jgi:hypothetical protein
MSYVRINKRKYHFIYKTTCSLTGRYYIGMHSTDNLEDGYLGSGRRLMYSLQKYGKENHTREILEFCFSREELASREAEIVNLNEIAKEECMNFSVGGWGGIQNKEHIKKFQSGGAKYWSENIKTGVFRTKMCKIRKDKWLDDTYRKKVIESNKGKHFGNKSNLGQKASEETKLKMSNAHKGNKNSQYGTMWITNRKENKKIKKEDKIPEGWYKGRTSFVL